MCVYLCVLECDCVRVSDCVRVCMSVYAPVCVSVHVRPRMCVYVHLHVCARVHLPGLHGLYVYMYIPVSLAHSYQCTPACSCPSICPYKAADKSAGACVALYTCVCVWLHPYVSCSMSICLCVCVNTGPSVCSAWGCARTCGCARVMHTPARGPWEWHGPCSVTDGCPWMEVCAQPLCTGMSPRGVHSCEVQGEVWGAAPGAIPAAIPTEVFNLA